MSPRDWLLPYYESALERLEGLPGAKWSLQLVRWVWLLYGQLERDRAFERAGAMAYASLLALVPLLVFVVAILKVIGALEDDMETMREVVFGTVLGGVPKVGDWLWEGLLQLDFGTLGLAGIVGVVYMSARLYLLIEQAYTEIFGAKVRRSVYLRLVTFWAAMTTVPVVGYISITVAREAASEAGGSLAASTLVVFMQFLLLFAALKLLPSTKVAWGPALVGAFTSTVLLSLGQRGFRLYTTVFRSDDPLAVIYGSLGLILVVLLWLYLMWIFLLVGVEVAYVLQNFSSLLEAEQAERESQAVVSRRASLAQVLDTAAELARAFASDKGAVPETDLRSHTCLSLREQLAVLEVLRELGWVESVEQDRWILARPAQNLSLAEAADSWQRNTSPDVSGDAEKRLADALAAALPDTLADWLRASSDAE